MKLFKSVLLTGLLTCSVSVFAAVPYTFTNGTPANASEINANFTYLSDQIVALQAQLAGPTMTSLAGTYNIVEMSTRVDSNSAPSSFSVNSTTGVGTVTLNANGTGSVSSTNNSTYLNFSQNTVNVLTNMNIQSDNFLTGVYPAMGTVQGQSVVTGVGTSDNTAVRAIIPSTQNISNVIVSANVDSSSDGGALTWSLSGNVVTINAGDTITFSVAGKILVGASIQAGTPDGLIILVHQ